jgi:hypothetical protein
MSTAMNDRIQRDPLLVSAYRWALAFFPAAHRQEFGDELIYAVRMAAEEAMRQGKISSFRLAWRELRDLPLAAFREHLKERTAEMNTLPTSNYSGARASFRLGLANILFTILMIVILYTGFVAVTLKSLPLPVQLGLTIFLLAVPTILSIGSLVFGIRSVVRSNKANQKPSWMAVFGTLIGGMGTLNMGFILLGIIMETYGS